MLKSNELIISQFAVIGPDEFAISDPQDVRLGSARQTWKASDVLKGLHGVEIFDAAGTLVLSIEKPLCAFGDEYFVHRADPESGEKAELAYISKRFAWFSTRYNVHITGYPQMEINGEAFQIDYTLISHGQPIARVNAKSPGVGRSLMGKTAYRITLEPGLDEDLHAAVLGIAFALDMRRKKMRES